jgi:hypothetical protein
MLCNKILGMELDGGGRLGADIGDDDQLVIDDSSSVLPARPFSSAAMASRRLA